CSRSSICSFRISLSVSLPPSYSIVAICYSFWHLSLAGVPLINSRSPFLYFPFHKHVLVARLSVFRSARQFSWHAFLFFIPEGSSHATSSFFLFRKAVLMARLLFFVPQGSSHDMIFYFSFRKTVIPTPLLSF